MVIGRWSRCNGPVQPLSGAAARRRRRVDSASGRLVTSRRRWMGIALAALAAAACLSAAGCGSSPRSRVWITSERTRAAAQCASQRCAPYGVVFNWRIQFAAAAYDVFLNGSEVALVTRSPYRVGGMGCGTLVRLGVRAHDGTGHKGRLYAISYRTPRCAQLPRNSLAPYFTADTGRAVESETLKVGTGVWTNGPTSYRFQWQRCRTRPAQPPTTSDCVIIPGATSASYTVQRTDVGHSLVARVTATNSRGSSSTSVSGVCARGENDSQNASNMVPPPAEPAYCSPISAVAGTSRQSERFCSNAFVTCGYVDPLTGDVGVPAGTSLTTVSETCRCLPAGAQWSGGVLSITGDHVTVQNVYVSGSVAISGHDDKLTDSEVTTGICPQTCDRAEPIVLLSGATNTEVTYVTVSGGSNGTLHNGAGQPVLWDHVYSYGSCTGQLGWGDIDNSFIITDIRIANQHGQGPCHTEAGYVPGCTDAECAKWAAPPWGGACPGSCSHRSDYYTNYQGDVMLNPQDQTAAIFLDNHAFSATGNYNVTVNRSFVAGGGYAVYGDDPNDRSSNIMITNNRWSAMYFANGGAYGSCSWNSSGTVVSGNLWDDDLSPVTRRCDDHR